MIGGAAAFPRFVAHDLRLSLRGLMSMFGSLSPKGLGVLIALLFVALHAAAWPVAGWLIAIEDGPDGVARITAILASGVALTLPWIVGQSITEFTRTLFGRSDLELILASPPTRIACLLPAPCRLRLAPSHRWVSCWRRSPTSPLCGAIRIGSRSIPLCLQPGSWERASRSFWRWASS